METAGDHAREGHATCPGREELLQFSIGDLPHAELDALVEHLLQCVTCSRTLASLAAPTDGLVEAVLGSSGLAPLGDAENQLVKRLESLSSASLAPTESLFLGLAVWSHPVKRVGRYELLEEIGQGGMSAVFKARQESDGKLVAIKLLLISRSDRSRLLTRFQREMRAITQWEHPHLVRAVEAGEEAGVPFLAMELLEGQDLHRLVKRLGPLPIAEAAELARQAACGLDYAHQQGSVHRDIKPSNLILTSRGILKIVDFGLTLFRSDERLTSTSQLMGTADYMAPEQIANPHAVDHRADIYSLGCALYSLVAGHPPFGDAAHKTAVRKLEAHRQTPVPPLQVLRPESPAELVHLIEKMLAKDPCARFATAGEVATALQPLARDANCAALLTNFVADAASAGGN